MDMVQTGAKPTIATFTKKYSFTLILLAVMVAITAVVLWSGPSPSEGTPALTVGLALVLLAVGLVAGLLGGWIGTGGCSVMLPILHFWLGFPAAIAVGTTLFAVIFTAISGGYGHFRQKNVDGRAARGVGGAGILGVLIGSWLFTLLSDQSTLLGFIIGVVFLWPAFRMVWEGARGWRASSTGPGAGAPPQSPFIAGAPGALASFGAGVGLLTGLVGLGGGYALVPGLIYLFGAPVYLTMGTSLAVMVPLALVGGAIKLAQGYVFLAAALLLAVGTIVGAQIGAATIKRFKPHTLKLIFGIYFLYVAAKFIGNYLGIAIW